METNWQQDLAEVEERALQQPPPRAHTHRASDKPKSQSLKLCPNLVQLNLYLNMLNISTPRHCIRSSIEEPTYIIWETNTEGILWWRSFSIYSNFIGSAQQPQPPPRSASSATCTPITPTTGPHAQYVSHAQPDDPAIGKPLPKQPPLQIQQDLEPASKQPRLKAFPKDATPQPSGSPASLQLLNKMFRSRSSAKNKAQAH